MNFEEFVRACEEFKNNMNIKEIVREAKITTIKDVSSDGRITLLREVKRAGFKKGDRAVIFVPIEGVVVVIKAEGV